MATEAYHRGGRSPGSYEDDLGRDTPQLAIVDRYDEDTDSYYGNWVYGFGFIGVRFPARTSRDLTPDEVIRAERGHYSINNTYYGQFRAIGYDDVPRPPKLDDSAPAPVKPGEDETISL